MNDATLDLIFWIVVMAVLFLVIRWAQKRRKDKE